MNALSRPNIQYLEFDSTRLKENLWGDPSLRHVPVYLPPGYDAGSQKRYPVMYILAGWSGNGENYLNFNDTFSKSLPQLFDEAIQSETCSPFIAVFPDCSCKLGNSQYINSPVVGPYMDYLCDELVPFIDSHFSTLMQPENRGILGHSSGGYGALVTGMMRPDVFKNVCSSAGDSWFDFLYLQSIPKMIATLKNEKSIADFIHRFTQSPNPLKEFSRDQGETLMMLNMCACYAPNKNNKEFGGDLFFDLETGAVIPEVWNKVLSWDPVHMIDGHLESLKKLNWIHLQAGVSDEYGLHLGHRQFAKQLDKHGISYCLEEYPGKHGGHHHRFVERIQKMLNSF